jgi:hypothetical protein
MAASFTSKIPLGHTVDDVPLRIVVTVPVSRSVVAVSGIGVSISGVIVSITRSDVDTDAAG